MLNEKQKKVYIIIFWICFFSCFITLDFYKIESLLLDVLFVVSGIGWNFAHVMIIVINTKTKKRKKER